MKFEGAWQPSKYERRGDRLVVGSRVSSGSWLVAQLVADAYARHLPQHARGRLVDLGCGEVPLYAAYRPFVDEVVCVDWANSQYARAHLDLEHDLNEPLPFADARFDTAILSDVLEHIREPAALLGEIHRVLAPAGKLIANVPFMYWIHAAPYDYFRYTEFMLRTLIERAGLVLRELQPLGGGPEVVVDVLGKHLARIPVAGDGAARALQRAVYWGSGTPLWARSAFIESRARFPLGYFFVAERPAKASAPSG